MWLFIFVSVQAAEEIGVRAQHLLLPRDITQQAGNHLSRPQPLYCKVVVISVFLIIEKCSSKSTSDLL